MIPIVENSFPGGTLLRLTQGDLTTMPVDAIVNAANAHLQHGGGLAAAIARRGGPAIQQESDAWVRRNGLARHDRPAVTGAGRLPCRYVIHAVGPMWGEGNEDHKLAQAVRSALETAASLSVASLGLPAISTGIFGFPKPRAAAVILEAITDYLQASPATPLRRIELVLFDAETVEIFRDAFTRRFPPP
ncbi:MAG TPA: macro domain-containing protein [Anaerolineales bacterium]|nr:macro domain-containing protein [Anaerolineales bacterium]